jgi:16S rRNA processing protein RimM
MIKVDPLTNIRSRFQPGNRIYLAGESYKIIGVNEHKEQVRLKLAGVDSVEQGEQFGGKTVTVEEADRPKLQRDEFLAHDLVGLQARDPDGRVLGKVERVVPAPAADLLDISGELVPMVSEFVKKVDLEGGVVVVAPLEGMFEQEEAD